MDIYICAVVLCGCQRVQAQTLILMLVHTNRLDNQSHALLYKPSKIHLILKDMPERRTRLNCVYRGPQYDVVNKADCSNGIRSFCRDIVAHQDLCEQLCLTRFTRTP